MEGEAELVATCDIDKARADRAKAEYGAQQSFANADEMLAQSDLDGVVVLTPMVPHGPLSIAALGGRFHLVKWVETA